MLMPNKEPAMDQNFPSNRWKWSLTDEITYFLLFGGGLIGYFVGAYIAWLPSPQGCSTLSSWTG